MAEKPLYIYDLPFKPRREVCRILDADRRWEELGGIYMDVDVTTLTLIGQAIQREKSPTWELLNLLSERNGTVVQLFVMLAKMDHQRGMTVLLPYVDKKYHKYVHDVSASFSAMKLSDSIIHEQHRSYQPSGSQIGATCSRFTGLSMTKNVLLPGSKLTDDLLNLNHEVSSFTIQSKLNSLNHHHSSRRQDVARKSPEIRNFKAEPANCVESVTDNCVSEKIRNVRKISQPSQLDMLNKKANAIQDGEITSLANSLPDVMKISYEDIKSATNNFDNTRILGRGGFGAVYQGEWKGISVAIKRLMPKEGRDSVTQHLVSLKQSLNELNVLKSCRFDHILSLYGVSLDGLEPCLVYQLMVNGSLEDRLLCRKNTPPLTWSQRSSIAECTAKGLNYLHTTPGKPLVHGDIKSANILLDSNMEAKIGDFGLTREGPGCQDTHVKVSKLHGTECYLPPEYLRHRQLSPQVDIYSYGIVLQEIATGLRPYDNKREDAKLLVDHVIGCRVSGRLDFLRDPKAGEENMMWFGELIKIGQECSHRDKKKRLPMLQVLGCFNKIKEEISMLIKVRKLSNERGSLGDTSKLKQLTPRERQMLYDICKEKYGVTGVSSATSENTNSPPEHMNGASMMASAAAVDPAHTPTPEWSDNRIPPNMNEVQSRNVSNLPETGEAEPTPRCSQLLTSESSTVSDNSNDHSSNGKAPMPLLTVFQLQVSEQLEYSVTSKAGPSTSVDDENFSSSIYSDD